MEVTPTDSMTLEQKRALALARARLRTSGGAAPVPDDPIKTWRKGHPIEAGAVDFIHGAGGMTRGVLNVATPSMGEGNKGVGDLLRNPVADPESGAAFAGALLDPVAWSTGSNVARIAPYAKVLGAGVKGGVKALLKNLTAGAAAGGTIGGLTDSADNAKGAEHGAVVGALLNQTLPPALRGGVSLARFLGETVKPSPALLAVRAAGNKSDDVIAALTKQRAEVPGTQLTAGQASVPANSAEFAALQKLVSEKDPSRYFGPTGVEGQQQAARQTAIQSVGGTEADLASAVAQRGAASEKAYESAFQVPVSADATLIGLMKNPFFKSALPDAIALAKANGVPLTNKGMPTPQGATQFLHYIKLSLDKQLGRTGDTALSRTEKHAVTRLQDELVSWLGAKNPAYEAARAGHQAASVPINQMEVGQELGRRLTLASGKESPAGFAGGVRKATLDTDVTGSPRIDVLDKGQRKVVDAIMADLGRDATWKKLAHEGMANLKERIGAHELPPTGFFKPIISAARGWFNRATGRMSERGLNELSALMADDPKQLATLMQQFTPAQRAMVMEKINSRTLPAIGGIVSATEQ